MNIEIKHRFTLKILVSGDYGSVKDCLEKNRGADLKGADLKGADLEGAYLRGADLGGAYLRGAYLGGADLGGADLKGADLGGADLGGADLKGADLRGAYLGGADLRGAYLGGADLRGAKSYRDSHAIFEEIVRRQRVSVFTDIEWSAIAQIIIHRLCWDSILKRFSDVVPHIFAVLAEAGFNEWLDYWKHLGKR